MHARACGHDRKAREVPLAVVILTVVDEVCISEDVGNQFDEIFYCQSKTSCFVVSSSMPLRQDRYCTQMLDTGRCQQGYISALLVLEADWDFLFSGCSESQTSEASWIVSSISCSHWEPDSQTRFIEITKE